MISKKDLQSIESLTREFWEARVLTDEFHALFRGKEIGHRIADYVDENTTAMLEKSLKVLHEVDVRGKRRSRSMGDVWVHSNGMYNPVNVKAGEAGMNGQPNMVSLTKLIEAILHEQVDSYYLLIVKMDRVDRPSKSGGGADIVITPHVYLVDMLDYLQYITFDSGPGQAMLKEKHFYEAYHAGNPPPTLSLAEKLVRMIDLYEDGNRRLFENREKKLDRIRAKVRLYNKRDSHSVDQSGMKLG
jgi:hypothetical protein